LKYYQDKFGKPYGMVAERDINRKTFDLEMNKVGGCYPAASCQKKKKKLCEEGFFLSALPLAEAREAMNWRLSWDAR
jgi:hypothetical protein